MLNDSGVRLESNLIHEDDDVLRVSKCAVLEHRARRIANSGDKEESGDDDVPANSIVGICYPVIILWIYAQRVKVHQVSFPLLKDQNAAAVPAS
jgi:hypothetical protein